MRRLSLLLLAGTCALGALADERSGSLPEPPPPVQNYQAPPKPPADEETIPEPEIVITTHGEDRYEEYRIAGRLYMIKVIPKVGKPYYLIDNEGRGDFSRSDAVPRISPPMWVIKRF